MSKIGAQLYTLRETLKTPGDIAKTLARVKQMGYDAVQVSALGPIETEELAKILRNEGLVCAATHVGLEMMRDTQKCVEYHQQLDCQYTAIGGHKPAEITAEAFTAFCKDFSEVAKTLARHGVRVGYHNHSKELAHVDGGRTILELMLHECDPAVWFEIDTYWITHGGGDPAAWIRKVAKSAPATAANRIPCVHVKDMVVNYAQEQSMCEVGAGNLPWERILKECEDADVRWYLVERDRGDLDPFESLRISLYNLKNMGIR